MIWGLRSHSSNILRVRHPANADCHLDGAGLLLVLSVFIGPDPAAITNPCWLAALTCPARGAGSLGSTTLHSARVRLAALVGPTMASILIALEDSASTSELARSLVARPATSPTTWSCSFALDSLRNVASGGACCTHGPNLGPHWWSPTRRSRKRRPRFATCANAGQATPCWRAVNMYAIPQQASSNGSAATAASRTCSIWLPPHALRSRARLALQCLMSAGIIAYSLR
jgi:hypothetical protein